MTSTTRFRRITTLTFVAGALVLSACGDDGDTVTVDTPDGEVSVDLPDDVGADIDTEALQDAVDQDGDVDIDGVLDATGLDTKGFALQSAMGAESYEVDGSTLVLTFDKDGVDSAPTMDCMIAGAIVDEGDTVTLVYNDGEHTCE